MKVSTVIEKITGGARDRRHRRDYELRVARLPAAHRDTLKALERYLLYVGPISRGDVWVRLHHDLLDLFEQGAADGTPIRGIVGDDPVGFAEDFLRNYADGQWIRTESERLTRAVEAAAAHEPR